jgi:uncharacterized membrane protein YecN with MAPEG domain
MILNALLEGAYAPLLILNVIVLLVLCMAQRQRWVVRLALIGLWVNAVALAILVAAVHRDTGNSEARSMGMMLTVPILFEFILLLATYFWLRLHSPQC